jgi:hypothetical protein
MTLKDVDTHSSEMKMPIKFHAAAALAKALIQYQKDKCLRRAFDAI